MAKIPDDIIRKASRVVLKLDPSVAIGSAIWDERRRCENIILAQIADLTEVAADDDWHARQIHLLEKLLAEIRS